MAGTLEETNEKLSALTIATEKLVEQRTDEQKDDSSPSAESGMVDSEGNKLVLSKSGNLMQAGADGKATIMSPVGATSKAPRAPVMALPRMGDAGRAGQAEDEAEGGKPDEERNSLLSKMTGFLADQAKEKGKVAKLGLKAFFGTLVFGGFLIALGKFLQSDTFKKATEFIDKTLIPKLKEFYNAFFGPDGGLFKGIKTLFGDESGIGAIVLGIAGVTALMGVAALKAIFSPLTLGLGLLFKGLKRIGKMIPKVPGAGPVRGAPPGVGPKGGGPRGGPSRRPRGRVGALLNIGKILADKAKKLVKSGGAKTVAKVAGTAAVAGAAVAATRSPTPPTAAPSKAPTVAPSKIPQTAGAAKPPTPPAAAPSKIPTAGAPKAPAAAKSVNPLKKFPKVGKFLGVAKKIPGLSAIFAISDLISIFGNDDLSTKAKISAGVGVFGGLGASMLGGALGMMFGGPIGAALGGLVGYFGGEMLATGLMQWMLGETVDAFPDSWFLPDINGWMNGSGGAKTTGAGGGAKTGGAGGGAKTGGAGGDAGTGIPMSMPGDAAPAPAAALVDSKGKKLSKGMQARVAKLPKEFQNQEFANFIKAPMTDKDSLNRKSMKTAVRDYEAAIKRGDVVDPRSKEQLAAGREGQQLARSNMPGGGTVASGDVVTLSDGTMVTKNDPRRVPDSAVEHLPRAERAAAKKAMIQSNNLNMRMNDLREQATLASQEAEGAGAGSMTQELALTRQNLLADEFNKLKAQDDALRKKFAPPPKKANIAQNRVGPQTADLRTAIQKKLAAQGEKQRAELTATQQGGGNTQINNVTKKDGDVTHMPKSDIRNNKYAALNQSAYLAGAI